jgi:ribosomal protein S18 acetylase RimI-like enzyme
MVRLQPMEQSEFEPFIENLARSYARDHIRTGRWTEQEGPQAARDEVNRILPAGRATPHQYFFTIYGGDPEQKVGAIWLAIEPQRAMVYDLIVEKEHRQHGYAEAAMRLLEPVARAQGAEKIALHVFGDNAGARRLYQRLGYSETNVMMSKSLGK